MGVCVFQIPADIAGSRLGFAAFSCGLQGAPQTLTVLAILLEGFKGEHR